MNLVLQQGKREIILIIILSLYTKNKKVFIYLFVLLCIFFRAPLAEFKENKFEILSPAYGRIDSIEKLDIGTKINILLDVSDVHVQYAPTSGIVKDTAYINGNFNPFFFLNTEKTNNNERMYTQISTELGDITIIQYAGMIARRIVNNLKLNEHLKKGQIFGMIKFSSRVDIILPSSLKLNVKKGDNVKGGITILAN